MIAQIKTTEERDSMAVWLHSPPQAVAPPEGGAGAGAVAADAPAEEKSGWRSRRSLDGLGVLNGKHNFKIGF